jgi:hypothetical protein
VWHIAHFETASPPPVKLLKILMVHLLLNIFHNTGATIMPNGIRPPNHHLTGLFKARRFNIAPGHTPGGMRHIPGPIKNQKITGIDKKKLKR